MGNQAYDLEFARIGKDVTICSLAKILSPQTISIGKAGLRNNLYDALGHYIPKSERA